MVYISYILHVRLNECILNEHTQIVYWFLYLNESSSLCYMYAVSLLQSALSHKSSNYLPLSIWNSWASECGDWFSLHLRDPGKGGGEGLPEDKAIWLHPVSYHSKAKTETKRSRYKNRCHVASLFMYYCTMWLSPNFS